jgi:hypothetical protein
MDPYAILGIAADATLAEAKAAYRRLAELFHPDRLQGLRKEVQAEGASRLREATEAMRVIGAGFGRPLAAPGHKAGAKAGPEPRPKPDPEAKGREAGWPIRAGHVDPGAPTWAPSDGATEAEARIYDVELHGLDGPKFHVRWSGRHAAATLAALRHAHRLDGAVRQVDWGSYEGVFDGAAIRRLLCSVLHDDAWRQQPAEVVHLTADLNGRLVPARGDGVANRCVELGAVLDLLDEGRRYSVQADVY